MLTSSAAIQFVANISLSDANDDTWMQRMQLDKATGAKCFTLSASALQIPPYARRGNWTRVGSDFDYNKRGKRFDRSVFSFFSTINLFNYVCYTFLRLPP
jgi:hypothetical protein